MKKTKIIIPALAMLLLSTAASVSGTVAWFSMNNAVTVNGMAVTTRVSSNLLISEQDVAANFGESLTQNREGVLEPVSTVDGKAFFYTVNAKGDGDAKAEVYVPYSEAQVNDPSNALENVYAGKHYYDKAFNTAYGIASPSLGGEKFTQAEIDAAEEGDPAHDKTTDDWKVEPNASNQNVVYGYIDYTFYIKGTSGKDNQVLYMSKCNLLYNNYAITDGTNNPNYGGFAWRVALFADDATSSEPGTQTLKSILGLEQSKNFNQRNVAVNKAADDSGANLYTDANCTTPAPNPIVDAGIYYEKHSTDVPQAVKTASTLDVVTTPGAAAQATLDLDAGKNFKTKIVVRLWLEGEDISCTNDTYADLTEEWSLDLEFKLGDADDGAAENPVLTGVKNIGSVAA